jgi:hypothetical protein
MANALHGLAATEVATGYTEAAARLLAEGDRLLTEVNCSGSFAPDLLAQTRALLVERLGQTASPR